MRKFVLLTLVLILNVNSLSLTEEENEQLQESCGRQSGPAKRSTNGLPIDEEKAPFVAAIGLGPQNIYCTAVWISDRHVLTAAHCVNFVYQSGGRSFYPYVINTRNAGEREYQVLEAFKIEKVHYPMYYLPVLPSTFGDVAIVEVVQSDPKPVSKPACLPRNDVVFGGNVTMYGYGVNVADSESGVGLGVMRSINSTTVFCPLHGSFSICFNGFPYLACHGDSGGPLVTTSGEDRIVIHGVMATINHLCRKELWNDVVGYMNTGTNVFHHMDWICHSTGICPTKELSDFVKNFESTVKTKYKSFNVTDLPRYMV